MSDSTYQLDTDTAVGLLRDRTPAIRDRFQVVVDAGASVSISSVVLFELFYGVAKSGRPTDNDERLRVFLAGEISVLPFTEIDARIAGAIRAELAMIGTPIGPYDLLIAGQARARDAVLVTGNTGAFGRVRGLLIEDWRTPI